jgi:hypothetical protein
MKELQNPCPVFHSLSGLGIEENPFVTFRFRTDGPSADSCLKRQQVRVGRVDSAARAILETDHSAANLSRVELSC